MTEPQYRFIKGKGWVSSYAPEYTTQTERIGRYVVTMTLRAPSTGENYFISLSDKEEEAVARTMAAMHGRNWFNVWQRTPDVVRANIPRWEWASPGDHTVYVVVEFQEA